MSMPNQVQEPNEAIVVVYLKDDIEEILAKLDTFGTGGVSGIENMRKIVEVFDALKTKGNVQRAIISNKSNDTNLSNKEYQSPTVRERETIYDSNERVTEAVEGEVVDFEPNNQ